MNRIVAISVLLFIGTSLKAQENSRDNAADESESWRLPLISGGYPDKKFPKARISGEKPQSRDIGGKKNLSLEDFNKIMDRKIDEYYKSMQAEAKEDRRLERLMQKPQYSDPSYFGHKRKPDKRKLSRRKFCKECGIVH